MSTFTDTSPVQANSGYASNVIRAARDLVRALFAFVPRRALTGDRRATARDLPHLYTMAEQCDATLPNLAQEMRMIAARGY